ncbi:hypothetical protein GE061_000830 [Apolygus lucorum]|uniref:Uncharacterized protein n=1 Tax=Apolygus lucorum TaxID=248454 RepID=A0A8S9Y7K5_APOLU|nr:hypothetical protein GE061_000830 [Apolygus lucorum]
MWLSTLDVDDSIFERLWERDLSIYMITVRTATEQSTTNENKRSSELQIYAKSLIDLIIGGESKEKIELRRNASHCNREKKAFNLSNILKTEHYNKIVKNKNSYHINR